MDEREKSKDELLKEIETLRTKLGELQACQLEYRKSSEDLKVAYDKLKEAQAQLIQAEKLSAVGQLASGVAHEVRNPLSMIIQGVNYLEKKIPLNNKDIIETFEIIKDGIKRADRIIASILDFSKAEQLKMKEEDINDIIESALILMKSRFKSSNITATIETRKDLPKVKVDRNAMLQVFINLFLNAIQAMSRGGRIIIRCHDKKFAAVKKEFPESGGGIFNPDERTLIIEVEDNGIGISEENLKRIFVPFFTTKSPQGGSGLGLSVTRNIIGMHNALIAIKSKEGRGTTASIALKIS